MNYGRKPTLFIRPLVSLSYADAFHFARELGIGLNVSGSINLTKGLVPEPPQRFVSEFFTGIRKYLDDRAFPLHYGAVLENPDGGLNAHFLLHWPSELFPELDAVLHHWKVKAGSNNRYKVLKWELTDFPELKARYHLKGSEPEFCAEWSHLDHSPQGMIDGKRVFLSQTLNHAARIRAGYRPPREDHPVLGMRLR